MMTKCRSNIELTEIHLEAVVHAGAFAIMPTALFDEKPEALNVRCLSTAQKERLMTK
jgi:hypothetical protein